MSVKATAAAGTESERGGERGDGDRAAGAGQHLHQDAEDGVGDDRGDDGHVGDVHAERGESAVGEEDALHEQDDGDAEDPGVGADQDRGEGAAQQMSAGPGGHREVQHLHGEDEGGDQAGERGGPLVEFAAGAAQAHGDGARGDDSGDGGDGGIDESIWHMHRSIIIPSCEEVARARSPLKLRSGRTPLRATGAWASVRDRRDRRLTAPGTCARGRREEGGDRKTTHMKGWSRAAGERFP